MQPKLDLDIRFDVEGNPRLYFPVMFISDIHLGTKHARAKRLSQALQHTLTDQLFLDGDVFDGEHMRKKKRWNLGDWHRQVVGHICRKAATESEVTYIPGNHDGDIRNQMICRDGREYSHRNLCGNGIKAGFLQDVEINRRAEREKIGLDPDLPTALIMFGGNGSKKSIKIVKSLERSKFGFQSIVMCGNNKKLRKKLERRNEKLQKKSEKPKSCHPVGFVDNVPAYMGLADVAFGKPGPAFISESVHCGVPVIIELNEFTMPQESPNAEFVEKNKVGLVIKSFEKHTEKALRRLYKANTLEQLRQNTRLVRNQAVFEIPPIFEKIMNENMAPHYAAVPAQAERTTRMEPQ